MKFNFHVLLYLIILAFLMPACVSFKPVYFSDDKKLAEKAVEKFHQLYNDRNFNEAYEMAHEAAKAENGKDKMISVLEGIYAKYGKVLDSKPVKAYVRMLSQNERQVEIIYETKYEKGRMNEFFLVVTNENEGKFYTYSELSDEQVKNLPESSN